MTRFISALKMDVTIQIRNHLYTIGIVAAILVAIGVSQLGGDRHMVNLVPALMLAVAGGSTLLYVSAMIIFERDEGTLNAVIVSPLRTSEYLWSKIITLTTLATLEAIIMIGGAMLIMSRTEPVTMPNLLIGLPGIVVVGILYTLLGIVLIVRYDKITDYLLPMALIATILQLPLLYFLGVVPHPVFLVIPSSAPIMLIKGAYVSLEAWQWVYALGYTAVQLIGLIIWTYRAFHTHIIMKVG